MSLIKGYIGDIFVTPDLGNAMENSIKFKNQVHEAFMKYLSCNWGDTCPEDGALNNYSAQNPGEGRIFAVYNTCKGRIFIITEWDRSVTTILFPYEY